MRLFEFAEQRYRFTQALQMDSRAKMQLQASIDPLQLHWGFELSSVLQCYARIRVH